MKSAIKFGSLLLAVMMVFTSVFASGCSLSKEWSYKSGDIELPIGVYIYSLDSAFQQGQTLAKKLDDYDAANDKWLDLEITDEDGNTAVARQWILDQAEKMCLKYIALEQAIKEEGATVDSASLEAANDQSKEYWDVGQYASYGYVMPMKDELEPFGISYDSFRYCTAQYSVNYNTLFNALYAKGGSQEVSDSELKEFFNDSYVDYSFFSVNLYESTTDEAGESSSVALSDEKIQEITAELEGYAKNINSDESYENAVDKYMKANDLEESPSKDTTECFEDFSMGDELKAAVEKLDNNRATTVKVGEGESAIMYLVYKKNINDITDDYMESDSNRASVLSKMKTDDFDKYLDELAEKVDSEKNGAVDKYDPKIFFVPEEPTTAAEETTAEGAESAADSGE